MNSITNNILKTINTTKYYHIFYWRVHLWFIQFNNY